MKSMIFLCFTLFFVSIFLNAGATIRTVCNYPVNVAQFNTLQEAADASNSGDTLLVQGSTVLYEGFTIQDKKLMVIGPGWAPIRNTSPLTAQVKFILINGSSSSGTEIQGLVMTGGTNPSGIRLQEYVPINNIRIIRNFFNGQGLYISNSSGIGNGTVCSGYTIEGNYFSQANIAFRTSNRFENSIIQNNVFFYSGLFQFNLCNGVIVNHNIFYRGTISYNPFTDCQSMTIQNNIFCRAEPGAGTANCFFKNNITFNTSTTAPWTLNGNSNQGGNILNQDPKMFDQSAVNSGTNNALLNFSILASSPAKNTGSDGKDMGLLYDTTGSLNWTNSRNSRIPYVYNVNITNNTIQPNGTLNVSLEARKQN